MLRLFYVIPLTLSSSNMLFYQKFFKLLNSLSMVTAELHVGYILCELTVFYFSTITIVMVIRLKLIEYQQYMFHWA